MLRWLSGGGGGKPSRPAETRDGGGDEKTLRPHVTDDPLATIDLTRNHRNAKRHQHRHHHQQVYAVSRSVLLPRVALKCQSGINPIFVDDSVNNLECTKPSQQKHPPNNPRLSPPSAGKSASSGYVSQLQSHSGSSQSDPIYSRPSTDAHQQNPPLREDALKVLEQNINFVKSMMVAVSGKMPPDNGGKSKKPNGSLGSSTTGGTLSTIPEGKVDIGVPRPIWPKTEDSAINNYGQLENYNYDSLVDESLLLYTSLNYNNHVPANSSPPCDNKCAKDILRELSQTISAAVDGKTTITPEELLKGINERITLGLEVLQRHITENDMRNLSTNLRTSDKLTTVAKALSNKSTSSSSGNSSQLFDDWDRQKRVRTSSNNSDIEEFYQVPSASSSSGFSDLVPSPKTRVNSVSGRRNQLNCDGQLSGTNLSNEVATHSVELGQLPSAVFVHSDLSSVSNGVRNAMIYGTLSKESTEKLIDSKSAEQAKLQRAHDEKPSLWEIYYGAGVAEGDVKFKAKSSDLQHYHFGGRPEADFTLDVPKAELLMRKMKADKKWRCQCRIVTSLLGLIFFLLSVMAVSLMLTRGKRMFGSML